MWGHCMYACRDDWVWHGQGSSSSAGSELESTFKWPSRKCPSIGYSPVSDYTFYSNALILPKSARVTLDTPANRKGMPNANFSDWTPLEFVAETAWRWANDQDCPDTGSLLSLITSNGETTITRENWTTPLYQVYILTESLTLYQVYILCLLLSKWFELSCKSGN